VRGVFSTVFPEFTLVFHPLRNPEVFIVCLLHSLRAYIYRINCSTYLLTLKLKLKEMALFGVQIMH